jgi:hypothetical protein
VRRDPDGVLGFARAGNDAGSRYVGVDPVHPDCFDLDSIFGRWRVEQSGRPAQLCHPSSSGTVIGASDHTGGADAQRGGLADGRRGAAVRERRRDSERRS